MGAFDDLIPGGGRPAGGAFDDLIPANQPGDTWRGLKESFQQLPQLGYGVLAGVGAAAENVVGEGGIATGIKKAGVKGYTEWGDKIAAGSKPSDSMDYSWEQAKEGNFGALVDWLQHGIGYVGGQGLQMLATAGIGAAGGKLVASTAAKQIAEGMVAKEAARLTAAGIAADQIEKAAVANVASKFATIGMNTALGGAAVGMEGGEIFGGLTQEAEKEGRTLTGGELGKAFGATLAAGGLEFVGDKLGLDIVLGKSKFLKPAEFAKGLTGRAGRGLIAAGLQAPVEAGTEYGQTMLEEYGKGNDPTSDESLKQARESAWLGALGGAAIGGVGGAIQPAKLRPQEEERPITEGIDKIANAGSVDEAIAAAAQAVSPPAAAPTHADRVAAVRAELSDRSVMDALRSTYGDSVSDFLNSVNQAGNPQATPDVREKHLQAVEDALFKMRTKRADDTALAGPDPLAAIGMDEGPALIGLDTTPTGAMRVGPNGVAVPEVNADRISLADRLRAMRERGLTGQTPRGGEPGAGVLVGDGTLTPGFERRPVEQGPPRALPAPPAQIEATTKEPYAPAAPTTTAVQPAEVAAPAGEVRGTEPTGSGPVLPAVEADTGRRVDSPAETDARVGRETVPVGAGTSDAEPALTIPAPTPAQAAQVPELGTDIPTLKRQWQDAVRAGDGTLAKRINARIIEVKNAAPYVGPTMAEVEAIQDIPTTEKMREAIAAVGEDEFTRMVEERYAEHKPQTEDQKALLVEAAAIHAIAMSRRKDQVEALRKKKAEAAPAVEAPAAEPAQTVSESDFQEALRTARVYKSRPAAENAAQAAGPEYVVHGEPGNWRVKRSEAPVQQPAPAAAPEADVTPVEAKPERDPAKIELRKRDSVLNKLLECLQS